MTMSRPRALIGHDGRRDIDPRRARDLRFRRRLGALLGLLMLGGCGAGQPARPVPSAPTDTAATQSPATPEESRMWITVGDRRFAVTLADNATARAFAARLPLTMDMAELNGNEKHADLREALPANASRPGTIRNGDLVLYGTNTVVVFYATFNSSYSYTRLGRVDDPAELPQALGRGGIRVVFSRD